MNKSILKEICEKKEQNLSIYATKSKDAVRSKEEKEDIRPAFFRDIDRILHSVSFTRYADKTQVFSYKENDHISKRIVHVSLVSKIARTIGRFLELNEDLIEAIALGHDIGHTPLGHFGESCLNEISMKNIGIPFMHNLNSVRTYLVLDNNGKGRNLTIQALDGIMCHNGEMVNNIYKPIKKTKEEFLNEYFKCTKDKEYAKTIKPMTLEGCVVRISDIIGYLGRDIEDAISLKRLKREDIPKDITDVLGNTNKEIVNTIIMDIINNSYNKPYIKLSTKIFKAIGDLKDFNYENIYNKSNTKKDLEYYKKGFNILYNKYIDDIKNKNNNSLINSIYLNTMTNDYKKNTLPEQIVIDFISGMTDDFFLNEYKSNC